MSKKKKITIVVSILLFTFIWALFDYYFAVEKTIVRNETKKELFKVIPEENINKIKNSRKVILNNVLPINLSLLPTNRKVTNDHVYNVVETIQFKEIVEGINDKDIQNLNELFLDYIVKENDALFFKADFIPLFERKVGDEVSIKIGDEEFFGVVSQSNITLPTNEERQKGLDGVYYSLIITPTLGNYDQYININGGLRPNGEYHYFGNIEYGSINGEQRFEIDKNIGVMIPEQKFSNYIYRSYEPSADE